MAQTPDRTTHSAARFAVLPTAALAKMAQSKREGSGRMRGQRDSPRNVWLIGELRLGGDGLVTQYDGCEAHGALKGAQIELWVDLVLWCVGMGCQVGRPQAYLTVNL